MNKKITLLIIAILTILSKSESQTKYDTTFLSKSLYDKLNFVVGNSEMQYYEVTETDIGIRSGEVEKNKTSVDTIGIKNISTNLLLEQYEIELSVDSWTNILFERECSFLADHIEIYPILRIERNVIDNTLTFKEPKQIGNFIRNIYEERIDCLESSDDKYMIKHLKNWIKLIERDSINEFTTLLTSHFSNISSLYDMVAPINNLDTVICRISSLDTEYLVEFAYESTRLLNSDSSTTILFTDNVEGVKSSQQQFVESLYQPFAKYHNEEEKNINEIRIKSIKSTDKSDLKINKNGQFECYLRIMESFGLDAELKPKLSFFNFKIERIKNL